MWIGFGPIKEGLFAVLISMQNGKSLGLDGLSCEFYYALWDTVGDGFCCSITKAFSSWALTKSLIRGLIKFILKNVAKDSIGGKWPITLCIIAYKILATGGSLYLQCS